MENQSNTHQGSGMENPGLNNIPNKNTPPAPPLSNSGMAPPSPPIPEAPKPPIESIPIKSENTPTKATVIDVNHTPNIEESQSIGSLMKKGTIAFFEYIIEFEEEHPWIFFIGIALILFVIIGSVSSMIFGLDSDSFSKINIFGNSDTEIVEEEEEEEERIEIQESLAAIQGIDIAFQISNIKAYDDIAYKHSRNAFLANDVTYIKKLDAILARDIQKELSTLSNENKYSHLREYLVNLIDIEKEGTKKYSELRTQVDNFKNERSYYEDQKEKAQSYLNEIMWIAEENEVGAAIEKVEETVEQYDEIDSKISLAEPVLNSYPEPLKLAQARIAGIRANKDLLLSGLKAIEIDETGLNFQESGEISKWYKSDIPMGNQNADLQSYLNNTNTNTKYTENTTANTNSIQSNNSQNNDFVSEDMLNGVMGTRNFQARDVPTL